MARPVGVGDGVEDGDLVLSGCLSLYTVKTTSCRMTSKSQVITDPLSVILIMPSWTCPLVTEMKKLQLGTIG